MCAGGLKRRVSAVNVFGLRTPPETAGSPKACAIARPMTVQEYAGSLEYRIFCYIEKHRRSGAISIQPQAITNYLCVSTFTAEVSALLQSSEAHSGAQSIVSDDHSSSAMRQLTSELIGSHVTLFADGTVYDGHWSNSMMSGEGRLLSDADSYTMRPVRLEADPIDTTTDQKVSVEYHGSWRHGLRHGKV